MVRYLKYIVIIFGCIGILVLGFFGFQNKNDISRAFAFKDKMDYEYLKGECKKVKEIYVYPCLKEVALDYFSKVSITGVGIGMKMAFNVMDEDKVNTNAFSNDIHRDIAFSLNYLELNNFALDAAYRHYFGIEGLYGGFLSSLRQFYKKGYDFSDNLIIGLEGSKGIETIEDPETRANLYARFETLKGQYYQIKTQVESFLEKEISRLAKQQ